MTIFALSRRRWFARASAAAVGAWSAGKAWSTRADAATADGADAAALPDGARLALLNLHTGEKADVVLVEGGQRLPDAQAEVARVLRDHRNGEVHPIDDAVLDQLVALRAMLGLTQPFHVISGFRSPASNAQLAAAGRAVARNSLHTQGRAVDFRVPGLDLRELHRAALDLRAGGVGLYARSGFVHVDCGRVRRWGG
jgi:uncharacterized protein YcbK (DUF882 family)